MVSVLGLIHTTSNLLSVFMMPKQSIIPSRTQYLAPMNYKCLWFLSGLFLEHIHTHRDGVTPLLQARVQQQRDLCVYAYGLVPILHFSRCVYLFCIFCEHTLECANVCLAICMCLLCMAPREEIELFNSYLMKMNFWVRTQVPVLFFLFGCFFFVFIL